MSKLNMIIATHGQFGEELVKSAEMIAGRLENVHCLSLLPSVSFEAFMHQADNLLSELTGPTIVLVDMFGGTPCNVLTVLSRKHHHHVVTGVNLPMLINLYSVAGISDDPDMEAIVNSCIETVQSSVVYTNKQLEENA